MISKEEQVENSLRVAYEKAAHLLRNADPSAVCSRTGAVFNGNCYSVQFIGEPYEIDMPDVAFASGTIPLIAEVLLLHYLVSGDSHPTRGEYVGFSDMPGGMFYAQSFRQRALDKLISRFGEASGDLLTAGQALGGQTWTAGDSSCIVPVLPKVDLIAQIYEADDEFPAEANILFPDSIVNFLPVEDIAFLGGYFAGSLIHAVS